MTGEFSTLAAAGEAEIRVKGSTFMGLAFPIAEEEQFRSTLLERSRVYFDASHHCAAFRLRDGGWRAIDAGEPGGSAGAPILAAIDGESLLDVGVVVIRYFGGTKLGVGGLVRAYGDAARTALSAAPRRSGIFGTRALIRYPYEMTSIVMRCLDRFENFDVAHGYAEDGGLAERYFTVRTSDLSALAALLRDESSGALGMSILNDSVVYR